MTQDTSSADPRAEIRRSVQARVEWLVSRRRLELMRSSDVFACTAAFIDDSSEPFSVVLVWPNEDVSEVALRLLVGTEAMRPIANRLLPGERLNITEGHRTIGRAEIDGAVT